MSLWWRESQEPWPPGDAVLFGGFRPHQVARLTFVHLAQKSRAVRVQTDQSSRSYTRLNSARDRKWRLNAVTWPKMSFCLTMYQTSSGQTGWGFSDPGSGMKKPRGLGPNGSLLEELYRTKFWVNNIRSFKLTFEQNPGSEVPTRQADLTNRDKWFNKVSVGCVHHVAWNH